MTLSVLGGLSGLTASYLSMIENGKRPLDRYSNIVALAAALRVPPAELAPGMPADLLGVQAKHERGTGERSRQSHAFEPAGTGIVHPRATVIAGDVLRAWRRSKGWDKPEMARRVRRAAGYSPVPAHDALVRMIHYWESGKRRLTERYELLYAAALGVEADALSLGPGTRHAKTASAAESVNDVLSPEDEERIILALQKPSCLDTSVVDSLATILAGQRQSEDVIGSGPLVKPVTAQVVMIEHLITEARGPVRPKVVNVASQWAEYAGWLYTSTGHPAEARAWFDRAVEWATECRNNTMVATAFSFKGHLAYLLGQIPSMVSLTQAAQQVPSVWVGQRAYDAYQEARGLAFLGDSEGAVRKINAGRELAALIGEKRVETPPWIYYYTTSFYSLEHALVYRYLGRDDAAANDEAITSFTAALGVLGNERSSEWAAEYIYHLALAYIQAGAPDKACETAMEVFRIARSTGSERLVKRTCHIHACLARRWPDDANMVQLGEVLRAADGKRYLILN